MQRSCVRSMLDMVEEQHGSSVAGTEKARENSERELEIEV